MERGKTWGGNCRLSDPHGREGSRLRPFHRAQGRWGPQVYLGLEASLQTGWLVEGGGLEWGFPQLAPVSRGGRGKRTRIKWNRARLGPSQVFATHPAAPRRKP